MHGLLPAHPLLCFLDVGGLVGFGEAFQFLIYVAIIVFCLGRQHINIDAFHGELLLLDVSNDLLGLGTLGLNLWFGCRAIFNFTRI